MENNERGAIDGYIAVVTFGLILVAILLGGALVHHLYHMGDPEPAQPAAVVLHPEDLRAIMTDLGALRERLGKLEERHARLDESTAAAQHEAATLIRALSDKLNDRR